MPSAIITIPTASEILTFNDVELLAYVREHLQRHGSVDIGVIGMEDLPEVQQDLVDEKLNIGAALLEDEIRAASAGARPGRINWDLEEKRTETKAYHALVTDGGRPAYCIIRLEEVFRGVDDESLLPWKTPREPGQPIFQMQWYDWHMYRKWQRHNRRPAEAEDSMASEQEQEQQQQQQQQEEEEEDSTTPSEHLEQLRESYEAMLNSNNYEDEDEGFEFYVQEDKERRMDAGETWPGMLESEYAMMRKFQARKDIYGAGINVHEDEGFTAFVAERTRHSLDPDIVDNMQRQVARLARKYAATQDLHPKLEWDELREGNVNGGFSAYAIEAKRRLDRHGFRQPVEFHADPTQQDEWATWMEYANYQCAWLDKLDRDLRRLQPRHDAAWTRLQESRSIRVDETVTRFCSRESSTLRVRDMESFEKTIQHSRESLELYAQEPVHPHPQAMMSEEERIQKMEKMERHLADLLKVAPILRKRSADITDFLKLHAVYTPIEKRLRLQRILLAWVREQISMLADGLHNNTSDEESSSGNESRGSSQSAHQRRQGRSRSTSSRSTWRRDVVVRGGMRVGARPRRQSVRSHNADFQLRPSVS